MKYMLLWAICFVALLQFSVVTCRSAHEKVTNKEDEKYSTTMSPTVAYTGQETDPWSLSLVVNSSNKLAFNPGAMTYDGSSYKYYYYVDDYMDYPLIFGCLFAAFVFFSFFGGIILMFCKARKVKPGLILWTNFQQSPSETQRSEASTASTSRESDLRTQQVPTLYTTVPYSQQLQPVLHYLPGQKPQQVPQCQTVLLQNQSQAGPSTDQASHQASPVKTDIETPVPVVEFSNPVCNLELNEN